MNEAKEPSVRYLLVQQGVTLQRILEELKSKADLKHVEKLAASDKKLHRRVKVLETDRLERVIVRASRAKVWRYVASILGGAASVAIVMSFVYYH